MTHPVRVPGLAPESWPTAVRDALTLTQRTNSGRLAASPHRTASTTGTKPLNILTVMANHPAVLPPFIPWATAIALQGVLSQRDNELLALRTVYRCGSEFEWGHHVEYGEVIAGMSRDDIDRVVAGPDAPGWLPHEAALVRAADELHDESTVSDATWAVLAVHYETAALVEIPFIVGQYTMLSFVANSLGVVLEDGYESLPG
jgi:4-carboxymuconolactone decarboxylase